MVEHGPPLPHDLDNTNRVTHLRPEHDIGSGRDRPPLPDLPTNIQDISRQDNLKVWHHTLVNTIIARLNTWAI